MSKKDIERFYNKVISDEELKNKVLEINNQVTTEDEKIDDIIFLANDNGFDFSREELLNYNEISDSCLENISGGFSLCIGGLGGGDKCGCAGIGYGKGGCFCPLYGAGS